MATKIILRNGVYDEVEEPLDFVKEHMHDPADIVVEMHAANGGHGWAEEAPPIWVRGSEIAMAYTVLDIPNPGVRRR